METSKKTAVKRAPVRTSVRLSKRIVSSVRSRALVNGRTVTAQIERYISAGMAAEAAPKQLEVRDE